MVKDDTPNPLKPYKVHGLDITTVNSSKQAVVECPWCQKVKFYVSAETGQYHCKVCDEKGNVYTFFKKIVKDGLANWSEPTFSDLATDRGLLQVSTLKAWGVCKNFLTGEIVIPGYNQEGKIVQLYRYVKLPSKSKPILLAATGLGLGFFAPFGCSLLHGLTEKKVKNLIQCEGPWDGMTMWETMRQMKFSGEVLRSEWTRVAQTESSCLTSTAVIALPGTNARSDKWNPIYANRDVTLIYDNDHERDVAGKKVAAGRDGCNAMIAGLSKAEQPPKTIKFLQWSKTSQIDPNLPDGYDVRDLLKLKPTMRERGDKLVEMFTNFVKPIPSETVPGRDKKAQKTGSVQLTLSHTETYRELQSAFRKAYKWTDGLDHALSCMLASITSTMAVGDQLWIKVVGPPSCGKSTLCEALSTNSKRVVAVSTMRGFHSGFQTDRNGAEDNSLLNKLKGMTLITKDGDTLLQSPNLSQILSEARDIYDRVTRTEYRNKMSKSYTGLSLTWILCGTSSLRSLDNSELGERFLDVVIAERIDPDLEDEILIRSARKSYNNMSLSVEENPESRQSPEETKAYQLAGGYVEYLRTNANELLSKVKATDEQLKKCIHLGKFVAYLRARPSSRQIETAQREFATRLVGQIIRMATCLSAVLNKKEFDEEVLRRTTQVAYDTARGITLSLVTHLNKYPHGLPSSMIAMLLSQPTATVTGLLRFLRQIEVLEIYHPEKDGVKTKTIHYVLHPRFRELFEIVSTYERYSQDV